MADLNQAGRALGAALFGGEAIERAARQKEELRLLGVDSGRAELDRKITQAYLERDKRNAQQQYRTGLEANGYTPDMAELLSNAMIGGDANLEQVQKFDLRRRAEPALIASGLTPANAILGALQGKPIPAVDIDGGYEVRGQYGAAPTVSATPGELADIASTQALANQRNVRAGLLPGESASLVASRAPVAVVGAGGTYTGGAPKAVKQAEAILADARSDPELDLTGFDLEQVADTMRRTNRFTAPTRKGPNTIRFITADKVEEIAVQPVKDAAKGNQPSPLAPSAQRHVPPPAQRVKNQIYDTRRGPMRWVGNGWVAP